MKWFHSLAAAACLLATAPLVQAGPDEDYVSIYQMLEESDQLLANGQTTQARARFQAVQNALKKFKAAYPFWNQATVDFRLKYVEERLAKLGGPAPQPAVTTPAPAPVVDPVQQLRINLAKIQEENKVLQAKLQEALAAQPAAIDPRELQKAEAQINALQKEKDL